MMQAQGVLEREKAQKQFVEMVPEIQKIAGHTFKSLDPEARDEAVAETVALCWKNHLHCVAGHKPVGSSSLAYYATLSVKSGRSLCGQSSRDVLARRTQLLGRASIQSLNAAPCARTADAEGAGWWDRSEALVDRRVWERPLERVRIKHDYGAFLAQDQVSDQEEEVFNLLAEGSRSGELAEQLRVSAPRVCQIKNSLAGKLIGFMGPGIDPDYRVLRKKTWWMWASNRMLDHAIEWDAKGCVRRRSLSLPTHPDGHF